MFSLVLSLVLLELGAVHCACSADQRSVTFIKTTNYNGYYEGYYVYQGETTSGPRKHSRTYLSDYQTYTDTICLVPGVYTLLMDRRNGNYAWNGQLTIKIGTNVIGTYKATTTSNTSHFFIPYDVVIESWQYTNIPQSTTDWTMATIDWQSLSSFPDVTTVTRYFRYSYSIPDGESYYAIRMSISTNSGFRCYLNGEILYDWNMPSGTISPSTPSVSSSAVTYRSFSTLLSYLPQPISNKYFIAVEVHAASTSISGSETFSGSCAFIKDDDNVVNTSGSILSYPSYGSSEDDTPDMLFDGDLSTKWCFSLTGVSLPVWAVYTVPHQGRELVNKYSVSSADSLPMRDCISWNFYGSFSNETNWVLLDSRANVEWTARKQTKTYLLANEISYSNYKFECTTIASSSVTFFQMAEVTLMLSSHASDVSVETSYPNFAYVLPINTPFTLTPHKEKEVTFSIESGSLPQGLILNNRTGVISGIPTAGCSPQLVTIQVSDDTSTLLLYVQFTVVIPPTNLSYSFSITTLYPEREYVFEPSLNGSTSVFSIQSGSLPTGLVLNTLTGAILGIPSILGDYSVVIRAENQAGSISVTLVMNVENTPIYIDYPNVSCSLEKDVPFLATPVVIGNTTSFAIHSGSLPQGLSLNPASGAISGTPTEITPLSSVTISAMHDSAIITVVLSFQVLSAPSDFAYPQTSFILVSSIPFSTTPTITGDSLLYSIVSGTLPTGISLNSASGALSGIPSQTSFSNTLVIKAENAIQSCTTSVTLTVLTTAALFSYPTSSYYLPLNKTASLLPSCYLPFTQFSLVNGFLPPGLTLNSSTGEITGIPTESMSSESITIQAVKDLTLVTTSISITSLPTPSTLEYPQNEYSVITGVPFMTSPSEINDSVTYSLMSGNLPSGLILNSDSGAISGTTSTYSGIFHIVIRVENNVGSSSFAMTLYVVTPPSSFSYPQSVVKAILNLAVKLVPTFSCSNPTFEVTSGTLPTGLTLNPVSGVISGVISERIAPSTIEITLSNRGGSIPFVIQLSVITLPSTFTYPSLAYTLKLGKSFSTTPTVDEAVEFSIKSGSLPSGLVLQENTGIISGIPTNELSNMIVVIEASNIAGSMSVQLVFSVKEVTWESYLVYILAGVTGLLLIAVIVLGCMVRTSSRKLPVKETPPKPTYKRKVHAKKVTKVISTDPVMETPSKVEEIHKEETIPPIHEETIPPIHEETLPPVHEEALPPVYEETIPPIHEEILPPIHEETIPPNPEDVHIEIEDISK